MTDLTPEEIATLRAEHRHWEAIALADECEECGHAWPCPAVRVLNALELVTESWKSSLRALAKAEQQWVAKLEASEEQVRLLQEALRVVEAARDVIAVKGTSVPIWLPVAGLNLALNLYDAALREHTEAAR